MGAKESKQWSLVGQSMENWATFLSSKRSIKKKKRVATSHGNEYMVGIQTLITIYGRHK